MTQMRRIDGPLESIVDMQPDIRGPRFCSPSLHSVTTLVPSLFFCFFFSSLVFRDRATMPASLVHSDVSVMMAGRRLVRRDHSKPTTAWYEMRQTLESARNQISVNILLGTIHMCKPICQQGALWLRGWYHGLTESPRQAHQGCWPMTYKKAPCSYCISSVCSVEPLQ